jgi:hypothetical protein
MAGNVGFGPVALFRWRSASDPWIPFGTRRSLVRIQSARSSSVHSERTLTQALPRDVVDLAPHATVRRPSRRGARSMDC